MTTNPCVRDVKSGLYQSAYGVLTVNVAVETGLVINGRNKNLSRECLKTTSQNEAVKSGKIKMEEI